MRTASLVLALALAGCGGGSKSSTTTPLPPTETPPPAEAAPAAATPPPPLSDADLEALMQKSLAMFQQMSQAAADAGDDCSKLAAGIEKVMGENRELLETAKKYKGDAEMEKRTEAWTNAHSTELSGALMPFASAAQKCGADPAFQAAMGKLDQ